MKADERTRATPRRATKGHCSASQLDPGPNWRAIAILGGSVFLLATVITLFIFGVFEKKLPADDRLVIERYEKIRVALVMDDLPAARRAAKGFLEPPGGGRAAMREAGQTLAASESLEAARVAFKTMSSEAARIVAGYHGYYVMYCPMKNCPMAKYGDWVQTHSSIENPFMGKAHPRCGTIRRH